VQLHRLDGSDGASAGHSVFGEGFPVVLITVHIFEEVFEGIGGLGTGVAFCDGGIEERDEFIINIFAEVFADPEEVLSGEFAYCGFLFDAEISGLNPDGGIELDGSGFVCESIDFFEVIGEGILQFLGEEVAGVFDDGLDDIIIYLVLFGDLGESRDDIAESGFDLFIGLIDQHGVEFVHIGIVF